ncbi:hypothetical protein [Paenibacillus larvae]|uniref:hypothetical protein n=1 Tax=Paenibacillus larvae TaxID=1464 RepID=UPI00227F2A5B|nr:hypothetical protein [Paenibacillus larvae]MEB8593749.1 hypothetical protein [Bacillus cereus]MCY7521044.1 hypothetical protein [Paenibacillus larvae]MCY9500678.1 hypothetical protein [Paenibacillus larvae]MCY9677538.1 hypothetical protein [Paenibacillus larvae]MCY9744715.1 hypothetical protein [Paenibacillus larvae]
MGEKIKLNGFLSEYWYEFVEEQCGNENCFENLIRVTDLKDREIGIYCRNCDADEYERL